MAAPGLGELSWHILHHDARALATKSKGYCGGAIMLNMLLFLPRIFRYFGMFQTAIGVLRPMWPHLSRIWGRMYGTRAIA